MSWTQETPKTSLEFIHSFGLNSAARIIDIGGGDSKLVDFLLEQGFKNISVLDISSASLQRAKQRLGEKAKTLTGLLATLLNLNLGRRTMYGTIARPFIF